MKENQPQNDQEEFVISRRKLLAGVLMTAGFVISGGNTLEEFVAIVNTDYDAPYVLTQEESQRLWGITSGICLFAAGSLLTIDTEEKEE